MKIKNDSQQMGGVPSYVELQYLVPLPMKIILFVGICFLLEKIPFFGNSKIVLFEKKKNEKE